MPQSNQPQRSAHEKLLARVVAVRKQLEKLEYDLMQAGEKELGKAIKRSRRELMLPVVTGAENTEGVASRAVRS